MAKWTRLGLEIEAGLKEALAHRQGKIRLASRMIVRLTEKTDGKTEKCRPHRNKVTV